MAGRGGRKRTATSPGTGPEHGGGPARRGRTRGRRRAVPAAAAAAAAPRNDALDDEPSAILELRAENQRLVEAAAAAAAAAAAEIRRLEEAAEASAAAAAGAEVRRREDASLAAGEYYSTIDQVWGLDTRPYSSPSLFLRLRRRSRHPNYASRPHGVNYYAVTAAPAVQPQYNPAFASNRSSLGDAARAVWPTDVFGGNPDGADIAHLIPHSATNASMYVDVALCAFGFDVDATWDTLQKSIHGSVLGEARQPDTGIKHRVPNKIRLFDQRRYFDHFPCILMVPIMNLRDVKCWNGKGYEAIIMVGSWGDVEASHVCRRIGMVRRADPPARAAEIEIARTLLTQFVLGLAHSLAHRMGNERVPPGPVRDLVSDVRQTLLSSAGNGVVVPAATSTPASDLRVYVVRFKNAYGSEDNVEDQDRHPAPDPLLLAARAAVTWSRRNHQPLLAATAEPSVLGAEWDDLDQLAAEQYLEERDLSTRPQNECDLARGLRQHSSCLDEEGRCSGLSRLDEQSRRPQ